MSEKDQIQEDIWNLDMALLRWLKPRLEAWVVKADEIIVVDKDTEEAARAGLRACNRAMADDMILWDKEDYERHQADLRKFAERLHYFWI